MFVYFSNSSACYTSRPFNLSYLITLVAFNEEQNLLSHILLLFFGAQYCLPHSGFRQMKYLFKFWLLFLSYREWTVVAKCLYFQNMWFRVCPIIEVFRFTILHCKNINFEVH
jgi:hypothetical protein